TSLSFLSFLFTSTAPPEIYPLSLHDALPISLGELSSVHPAAGSFGLYGDIYLNQWAGFIARAGYWAAIAVSIGAELVASATYMRSEEHTSELQSRGHLVCRLLLEKKKRNNIN